MNNYDLGIVLPVLNESQTLQMCIDEINDTLQKTSINYHIIIADNGSDDGSIEIAERLKNTTVIHVKQKGYGSALHAGIEASNSKYVVFADADYTYPFNLLETMYKKIKEEDVDLLIASRFKGDIEEGAMPYLHRYLGTPILTKSINFLYKANYSDCNSGYRIFKKTSYETWNMSSLGMDFASEMLIKAAKNHNKVMEIKGGLRKDIREDRVPHLKTWRDGMRHLLYIFSQAPHFFEISGVLIFSISLILSIVSSFNGILLFNSIGIFGLHSQIIFASLMIIGVELYTTSFVLYLKNNDKYHIALTKKLLEIRDDYLFFSLISVLFTMFISFIFFLEYWIAHKMQSITLHTEVLLIASILLSSYILISNLLKFHLLKRVVS